MSVAVTDSGLPRLWRGIGLLAFSLATAYSVLLVLLRVPSGLAAVTLFRPALAAHVVLAMWGWFLCVVVAGWCEYAGAGGWGRRAAVPAVAGVLVLATAPFFGERVLPVNYLPWIEHPLFAVGVALIAAAVLVAAATTARALYVRPAAGVGDDGIAAGWGVAIVGLAALSAARTGFAVDLSPEQRLWGPVHLMQFLFVIAMCDSWMRVLGGSGRFWGMHYASWLGGVAGLGFLALLTVSPASVAYHDGYTWLMSVGLWPVPVAIAIRAVRQRRLHARTAAAQAVGLSMLLFVAGCVLGALIRGDSLLIPAHYHATVGAITLALMARYHSVPTAAKGAARAQVATYASGLLLMCAGLVVGALAALPRKTPWHELAAAGDSLATASAGLLAVGGVAAITGAFGFVALGWWAMLGPRAGGVAWNAAGLNTELKNGNSRG